MTSTRVKNRIIGPAIALALVASLRWAGAQSVPVSGLYQIVSGTYDVCCGIGGDFRTDLPNEQQSFVRLTVDPQSHLATMTFLGKDMQTVHSIMPCPSGNPIPFSFNFGFIFSNSIIFHIDPGPPPNAVAWSYLVTNSADTLRINGTLGIVQATCLDVPTRFSHSNVVAVLMPTASIRISEVEVCWDSVSNRNYQMQYRSTLTTNVWTNLGAPVAGKEVKTCITDKVTVGEPQRYYRVLTVPGAAPVRLRALR
jgi:hypothetical protein